MRAIAPLSGWILWAAIAAAQTPIGPEFVPASTTIDTFEQFGAAVACDDASICGLVWTSYKPDSYVNNDHQWARTISPLGELSAIQLLRKNDGIEPGAVMLPRHRGFVLMGGKTYPDGVHAPTLRFYNRSFTPLGDFVRLPYHGPSVFGDPDSFSGTGPVAAIPEGFVELTTGYDLPVPPPGCEICQLGLFLYFFDREGKKLRDRVEVSQDPTGWETAGFGSLAVDDQGNIIVTFSRTYTVFPTSFDVLIRRFSPTGDPLSPEIRVNTSVGRNETNPVVAASPDGEFLVVWQTAGADNFGDIYARRFGAGGEPMGRQFLVGTGYGLDRYPLVVSDRHGNYFITWDSYAGGHASDVMGRLYHHDGTPVARAFRVNQDFVDDQDVGLATFAPNGTLTVSWQSTSFEQTHGEAMVPVVRRYAASPGQEICSISGAKVLCDLGRTGGPSELQLDWGGRREEVTLFGDVDGDGRDEVCSYLRGRFSCDLDHEGSPAEWSEVFGSPGDAPLLADVDGDGRADPCVRRKQLLLCDTARDGRVHFRVRFGPPRGVALLGDLDGDHHADLCLVSNAFWDCLLARTGERFHFRFGEAGDSPALGDLDEDGRADPCVLRAGTLHCNTAHDGGTSEQTLVVAAPTDARLLFGNLDGL